MEMFGEDLRLSEFPLNICIYFMESYCDRKTDFKIMLTGMLTVLLGALVTRIATSCCHQ